MSDPANTGETFVRSVLDEAPTSDRQTADEVTVATLRTLGERVDDGVARNLADHLPDGLGQAVIVEGPAQAFTFDEFVERVADRAAIAEDAVVPNAGAVAKVIAGYAPDELDAVRMQLPPEFDVIFHPSGPLTDDEFVEQVRERAELDSREDAHQVTRVVLETLADRLSSGQAIDLGRYLPAPLQESLPGAGSDAAEPMDLDEFVERIAERTETDRNRARRYAEVVCGMVAESVTDRVLDHTLEQLPGSYAALFAYDD